MNAQEWISFQSQQQINDLVDTGDQLFMATDAGLVVMDKATFEKSVFEIENPNTGNNHIQTVALSGSGDIWIGTYDGMLSRFDGIQFKDTTFPEGDYDPENFILYDLQVAPNGDLWLGTSDGVFKKSDNWTQYTSEFDIAPVVWDIEILDNNDIYFSSFNIYRFKDENWSEVTDTIDFFNYLDGDIFKSSSGTLYFSGDFDDIASFDGNNWKTYEVDLSDDSSFGTEIIGFAEDTNGNIFLNTENSGVYKLVNDEWVQESIVQTEQFKQKTSYLHIDSEGTIWLNNKIYLSVNKNGEVSSTTITEHTIENDRLNNMVKDAEGNIYFICYAASNISVLDINGNWGLLPYPIFADENETINSIYRISETSYWLSSKEGLHFYNGNEWLFYEMGYCRNFAARSDGTIYVQGSSGVIIIEDENISEFNAINSQIVGDFVSGIGVDENDNLWIADLNANNIYKVSSNGDWTTFSKNEFPALFEPTGNFHFDQEGNVWIPSDFFGALKFDGTNWSNPFDEDQNFNPDNIAEIEHSFVHSIASDAEGKIYFSHFQGVNTLKNGQWENLFIPTVPSNLTNNTRIQFDNNGNLWWGNSTYGIYKYELYPETTNNSAITVDTNPLKVYPNPAIDQLNLSFSQLNTNEHFQIFNQLGRLIKEGKIDQQNKSIDVSDLNNGFYVISLIQNEKVVSTKFLKQ